MPIKSKTKLGVIHGGWDGVSTRGTITVFLRRVVVQVSTVRNLLLFIAAKFIRGNALVLKPWEKQGRSAVQKYFDTISLSASIHPVFFLGRPDKDGRTQETPDDAELVRRSIRRGRGRDRFRARVQPPTWLHIGSIFPFFCFFFSCLFIYYSFWM